jgi:hypothetical protein
VKVSDPAESLGGGTRTSVEEEGDKAIVEAAGDKSVLWDIVREDLASLWDAGLFPKPREIAAFSEEDL